MLLSPTNLSPRQKSNWKEKIWRISSSLSGKFPQSYGPLQRTPKNSPRIPSLSSSPTLTPGSIKHRRQDDDIFLTPLDVLDQKSEMNNLLDNQIGLVFGDWSIPPPPPRKRTELNTGKLQLLPSKTISGPRVKPYFTTSSRLEVNVNQETCFICKDVLETKLDSEKLVPLECGDCVHGDCLRANVDVLLEEALKKGEFTKFSSEQSIEGRIFPTCRGDCCTSSKTSSPVVPKAKDMISDLMADVMLSVKLATMSTRSPEIEIDTPTPLVFGPENRISRHFFKDNQLLRPRSVATAYSPGSQALFNETLDSINDAIFEESEILTDSDYNTQRLEEVKNHFIKHMMSRYTDFNLVVLVSLGSLRLVDRLQVAFEDGPYLEFIVYLFSNFIVLETEGPSPELFPLNAEYTITTPETSVLQFKTSKGGVPTLRLNSEIDAVIEKWGIALSDSLLLLPTDVITSSIDLSELSCAHNPKGNARTSNKARNSTRFSGRTGKRTSSRISTVLIIEPREIWSERPNNFEQELMRIGVLGFSEPQTNLFDTLPTSPLNIIRADKANTISMPLGEQRALDTSSDSDNDSDSDLELIYQVMHKRRMS